MCGWGGEQQVIETIAFTFPGSERTKEADAART